MPPGNHTHTHVHTRKHTPKEHANLRQTSNDFV